MCVHSFARSSVLQKRYDYVPQTNGCLEVLSFAQICMLTRYVCMAISIKIIDVLDHHFQSPRQRFELNTMAYLKCAGVCRYYGLFQSQRYRGVSGGKVYLSRQDMSKGVSLGEWLILSKMQRI